jgi:hypothetical protein
MRIRKPTQNLIVDAAAFVALALMLATGFVLRYMLPPGSGGAVGMHGAGAREYLTLWGLTRHEWGDVHYWASLALMALLALHLVLHWSWIASMVRGRAREGSGRRVALGVLGLLGVIALVAAPLLSPVEQQQRQPGGATPLAAPDTAATSDADGPTRGRHHRIRNIAEFIDGQTTLAEAAARCGGDAAAFRRRFSLPPETPLRARLGRLEQDGMLTVHEVRQACAERDP